MDSQILFFPDWNKIGRHIGKKLRGIINSPAGTGPSREERRTQRLRDAPRGLVYFDEFDDLEAWSAEHVDPVQRANTPLLKRSASRVHDHVGPTTKVLLCHDYSGGYHDYESVRPCLREDRMYACSYPQYVDTFVYFSHKLVCIPPPTWTNTMHRNGVKVLGTFIIEPGKGHVERILQVNGEFVVAKQLAAMADVFGFDGWLLNVESEFPKAIKQPTEKICALIRSLKRLLGPAGNVLWYDALTTENEVSYQNGLTARNAPFALAADSLFTNYKWTQKKLDETRSTCAKYGLHPMETSFGIDVWAQNTYMSGAPRRITFPPKGGGGTNTGLALSALAATGFSTAIFGPAWTHEHFSTSVARTESPAESVEHAMWLGKLLPPHLRCDCREGRPHHTQEYVGTPVVNHAREFPAGSAHFFQTDFTRAFQRVTHSETLSENTICPTLGFQTPLPHLLPMSVPAWEQAWNGPPTRVLYGELTDEPPGGLIVSTKTIGLDEKVAPLESRSQKGTAFRLCLFKLYMLADGSLAATIRFRCLGANMDVALGFYLGYKTTPESEKLCPIHIEIAVPRPNHVQDTTIILSFPTANSHLVELGVYGLGLIADPKPTALCQILNVTIKPRSHAKTSWTIDDVRVTERGDSSTHDKRLVWKWSGSNVSDLAFLPWSKTTGPFSYFGVMVGGKELGRAYCTEFPVYSGDFEVCNGEGVEVIIRGRLFGGNEVASFPLQLSRDALGFL